MWWKQKTLWTGIGGIVTAVGGYFTGAISPEVAWQMLVPSVQAIFLRLSVGKTPKKLLKQNTSRAGALSIVATAVGAATGTLPVAVAVQAGVSALAGIFLRQGINKNK